MKLIQLTFFLFFSFFLKAQKNFTYELYCEKSCNELCFKYTNVLNTRISVPSICTEHSYFNITYPNGNTYQYIESACYLGDMSLNPKEEFILPINFLSLLDRIEEYTKHSKKDKSFIKTLGVYKIEWIIQGLPTKILSMEFKGY